MEQKHQELPTPKKKKQKKNAKSNPCQANGVYSCSRPENTQQTASKDPEFDTRKKRKHEEQNLSSNKSSKKKHAKKQRQEEMNNVKGKVGDENTIRHQEPLSLSSQSVYSNVKANNKQKKSTLKASKNQKTSLSTVLVDDSQSEEEHTSRFNQFKAGKRSPIRKNIDNVDIISISAPLPVKVRSIDPTKDTRLLSHEFRSSAASEKYASERSTYNQGKFTTFEKDAVERAVQLYLSEKSIPADDLPHLINRKSKSNTSQNPYASKEYAGFIHNIQTTSAVNRSLDQLYWYMSRKYSPIAANGGERRKWTQEEDKLILKYYEELAGNWVKIDKLIGRANTRNR